MKYERTWEYTFATALQSRGYELTGCSHDPAFGWLISARHESNVYPGSVEFESDTTVEVLRRIEALPLYKHPEATEMLWASSIPLNAAAKVGKVHTVNPHSRRTLCGVMVGKPSKQFSVRPDDSRCSRCAKIARS